MVVFFISAILCSNRGERATHSRMDESSPYNGEHVKLSTKEPALYESTDLKFKTPHGTNVQCLSLEIAPGRAGGGCAGRQHGWEGFCFFIWVLVT